MGQKGFKKKLIIYKMELNIDSNVSDWLKEQKITKIPTKPNKTYPFPCNFKCCNAPNKVSLSKDNMIQKCLNCNTLISSGG